MSYRSLATIVHDPAAMADPLETAITAATQLGARLRILALDVTPSDPAVVFAGMGQFPPVLPYQGAGPGLAEMEKAIVARLSDGPLDWKLTTGRAMSSGLSDEVCNHCRFADLVVQGLPYGPQGSEAEAAIAEAILFQARVPLLAAPKGAKLSLGAPRVMLAWDNSSAALNAVRAALPMLERAASVTIAMVNPSGDAPDRSDPGGALLRFLASHGIRGDVSVITRTELQIGAVLLARAEALNSDVLVIGAFGHSRLREALFGGVTRHVLAHTSLPVLLAH